MTLRKKERNKERKKKEKRKKKKEKEKRKEVAFFYINCPSCPSGNYEHAVVGFNVREEKYICIEAGEYADGEDYIGLCRYYRKFLLPSFFFPSPSFRAFILYLNRPFYIIRTYLEFYTQLFFTEKQIQ